MEHAATFNVQGDWMRVLGLVGSPRKGGNTDLLVSRILDGATASNHLTERVYLYALEFRLALTVEAVRRANSNAQLMMACSGFTQSLKAPTQLFLARHCTGMDLLER